MKGKLLVIGPSSTHVIRFIHLVKNLFREIIYVGEEKLICENVTRHYRINFRSKNPVSIFKNYKLLKSIIESENPDITHIQQVNRVAYMASRCLTKTKRKHVVTAWGSDVLVIPDKSIFYRKMTQRVLNSASFITADSHDMLKAILKLSSNKNFKWVLLGIDPIDPGIKEKIIFSNRALFELYNIKGVIEEFDEFQKTNQDWKLVIAGVGDECDNLKSYVSELNLQNKVDFVGWLDSKENLDFYKRSAIYISMPVSDGTSVSLLEAMSAGCIPVLSDLPVSYEWIESGKNGIIKKRSDNALVQALKLNQGEVTAVNLKHILETATTSIATKNFKSIYDKVLNVTANQK